MAGGSAELHEAWNLEEEMTAGERILRDNFVNEYLKDFDPYRAAIRCGFIATFAVDWCKRLMSETYVLNRIADFTELQEADSAQQAALDKLRNMRRLRNIVATGSNTESIAAARELNAMLGLNKPEPNNDAEQSLIDVLKEFAQGAPL